MGEISCGFIMRPYCCAALSVTIVEIGTPALQGIFMTSCSLLLNDVDDVS